MRYLNHFIIFSQLAAIVLLAGCSASKSAFSKGEKLEAEGKFEAAMYSYADAFMKDPETGTYRIRFFSAREKAADLRFKAGNELYAKGEYAAALEQFQAGLGLDPTQSRFKQQADVAARMKEAQQAYRDGLEFEKGNKFKDAHLSYARALELHPENKEYQAARIRIATLRKSKLEGYELNLKSAKPITLKFKDAKMKDVFNILTQLSGINFIFDEGVKDTPVSIYLENATFQQAFDLLTNMNKLGKKILNENTVIVYVKSPEKSKQYEDMVLRTFHLNYLDAKKAINLIRTMIQVRKAYVNEDSNSVVVRDTSDIVDVVEKILDASDVQEPEVVLDVEVIEVSDKNAQSVGLLLSNYNVQLGAFNGTLPLSSTLVQTVDATKKEGTIDNLIKVFSTKGYGGFVTVPNAQYNLGKTLANGQVLSNPKIRVKNKEKSKFNVGTRVPITTTTLQNAISQVNVQYVDVGVKISAEPNIQLNNDIVIKLNLEVSSIISKETVGGKDSATTVVTIGTRNLETVLSLRDGETSIIGGLIQNSKNDSKQKIFLLGDIPLIGPLLSNNESSKEKTELILAITPRLVRGVTVPQGNLMSFSSGKEDDPSLVRPMASFEQEPVFDAATQPKGSVKKPAAPTAPAAPTTTATPVVQPVKMIAPAMLNPSPVSAAPAAQAVDTLPNSAVPAVPVAPAASVATPAPVTPAVPAVPVIPPPPKASAVAAPVPVQRGLLQISAPPSAAVGQQFSVDIKVDAVTDLANAPFTLSYDPIFVEFVSVAEGQFMKKDGKSTTFSSKADTAGGTVAISLARAAGSGGVSGGGSLVTFLFRAKNQGPAGFAFKSVGFSGANGNALTVLPFSTAVDIR